MTQDYRIVDGANISQWKFSSKQMEMCARCHVNHSSHSLTFVGKHFSRKSCHTPRKRNGVYITRGFNYYQTERFSRAVSTQTVAVYTEIVQYTNMTMQTPIESVTLTHLWIGTETNSRSVPNVSLLITVTAK